MYYWLLLYFNVKMSKKPDPPDSLPQNKFCYIDKDVRELTLLTKHGILNDFNENTDDIITSSILNINFMKPPSSTEPMVWFPYTKYMHSRLMFQDFTDDPKVNDKRHVIIWFHVLKLNYVIEKGLEIKFNCGGNSNEFLIEHILGDIRLRYAIIRFDDICQMNLSKIVKEPYGEDEIDWNNLLHDPNDLMNSKWIDNFEVILDEKRYIRCDGKCPMGETEISVRYKIDSNMCVKNIGKFKVNGKRWVRYDKGFYYFIIMLECAGNDFHRKLLYNLEKDQKKRFNLGSDDCNKRDLNGRYIGLPVFSDEIYEGFIIRRHKKGMITFNDMRKEVDKYVDEILS
jgi:hypothetical protein